jgi:hypothetical protein
MNHFKQCSIVCSLVYLLSPIYALAQTATASTAGIDPFTEKVLIAAVSAVLSLLSGYVLFQIKVRRTPRKRLSYDLETRHGLVTIEESVARNVSLTYKGRPADQLTYVRCDIKNTGNTVVKSEFLRFEFAEGAQILDAYTEPLPPKEYGVSEVSEPDLQPHERRYQIKHLEKLQHVAFRFVVSGAKEVEPKIIPFNEEGDVEVSAASISRASDDRQHVEQFVYLLVLFVILPPMFRFFPEFLNDIAAGLVYVILVLAMLPLVKSFSRAVANAIAALTRPEQSTVSISQLEQKEGAKISINTGPGMVSDSHLLEKVKEQ